MACLQSHGEYTLLVTFAELIQTQKKYATSLD